MTCDINYAYVHVSVNIISAQQKMYKSLKHIITIMYLKYESLEGATDEFSIVQGMVRILTTTKRRSLNGRSCAISSRAW